MMFGGSFRLAGQTSRDQRTKRRAAQQRASYEHEIIPLGRRIQATSRPLAVKAINTIEINYYLPQAC
jgi:hypothetical protein